MSKKVSKKSLSVPKKKKVIKKCFKGVHQVCPNKKKSGQKKFQRNPSSVPKQKKIVKRSSKEVPQLCPNNKKGTNLISPLIFRSSHQFQDFTSTSGDYIWKGDETRKRGETEYETQEGIIDNFVTWSLIFIKYSIPYKFLTNSFLKISST